MSDKDKGYNSTADELETLHFNFRGQSFYLSKHNVTGKYLWAATMETPSNYQLIQRHRSKISTTSKLSLSINIEN